MPRKPTTMTEVRVQVFVHRLRKYLGAYLLQLADLDDVAIVFSGGIGENSSLIRSMALENLDVRSSATVADAATVQQIRGFYGMSLSHTQIASCMSCEDKCLRGCSGGASPLTRRRMTRR